MKAKIAGMGFEAKILEVTGLGREIHGRNEDDEKAEVDFDPVESSITKAEIGR